MNTNRKISWLHDPRTTAILKGSVITIGMVVVAIIVGIGMDNFLHTSPLMITLFLILCIPGSMAVTLSIAKGADAKMKALRQKQADESQTGE
jgi:F0F1-type ATP synthase assembly protein I